MLKIAIARMTAAAVALIATIGAVAAMFVDTPGARVDEVPVERLLTNLERNAQNLPPPQLWRAIGRIHLIAYVRQTRTLPVYRKYPDTVAEWGVDDCAKVDKDGVSEESLKQWPKAKPGEICAVRDYSLAPRFEIPKGALDAGRRESKHLDGARDAYERAKALEPNNLRTRLALAFVRDRLSRLSEAREELRFALEEGGRRFPSKSRREQETRDWEMHVVLSEALHHLTLIADNDADRQLVARTKALLDANPPMRMVTPILVPLTSNTTFRNLIDHQSNVAFDFSGQGLAEHMGWLTPKAAWLVWDPKQKGKIEGGFQLFGSVTWMMFWDNGYHALGSLDDDGDRRIAGKELEGLALWHDKNANGVSDKGEVRAVTDHDIVALSYAHRRASQNLWISKAGVTFRDGETRPTYDWLLRSRDVLARN
jgi:hypothetical protein